jgi:hypothetical protein
MRRMWVLAVLMASDRNRGHDVYLGSSPWRKIHYILLV